MPQKCQNKLKRKGILLSEVQVSDACHTLTCKRLHDCVKHIKTNDTKNTIFRIKLRISLISHEDHTRFFARLWAMRDASFVELYIKSHFHVWSRC